MNAEKESSFPIIGIGASAGGLAPFIEILQTLPSDLQAAIVFIQHLLSDTKSLLPEILQNKFPSRDIVEISKGMAIEKGKIYVNPPNYDITIESGHFSETLRRSMGIHLPIDTFFYSLAENAQENAVAVILSGTGTDGSRGIREVQCKGGAVLVQDPATAEAPGMSESAIEAGNVDEVHAPKGIALRIANIVETNTKLHDTTQVEDQGSLNSLLNILHEKAAFRFEGYKKTVIARRALRRMSLLGLVSINEYLELIDKNPIEIGRLATDLMIGVTGFFRDPAAWDDLKREVIQKLITDKKPNDPIRVWTPGCSTGEEPYSIAMMLLHEIELAKKQGDILVFATDINESALAIARNGKYPGSAAVDIPSEYLRAFFNGTEDGSHIQINKYVRDHIIFAKQNLLIDPPFSKLDLIICRNLLIYIDPAAQDRCLSIFHYALKEGGYLFLGNAESIGQKKLFFKSMNDKNHRLYTCIAQERPVHYSLPTAYVSKLHPKDSEVIQVIKVNRNRADFAREQLLALYAPAAVLIDNRYDILYFNDPVKKFIGPPAGQPSFDFLAWIPEQMQSRVRGALYNASHTLQPVAVLLSLPIADNQEQAVTLTIRLLKDPIDQSDTFLIIFSDQAVPQPTEVPPMRSSEAQQAAIRQLEMELSNTRNELQINDEEMKSANEELQSSNEELQAANEEMETSREELQSLNEELTTVNGQLQIKIEELEITNNDINNFFSSTHIPTIFLDHQFNVRRFTSAMTKLIQLIPTDIGRPLADMSLEHLGAGVLDDARAVIENLASVKKEISIGNAFYLRSTLPYRTADNRIEGVVITLIDITELKRAEEALRESEEHFRLLFETMLQGVVYQDADGQIISMNHAAERILGKTPQEFLGNSSVGVERDTIREDGSLFPGLEHPAMVSLRTGENVHAQVMGVYNPRQKDYRWIIIDAVPLFQPGETKPYQVYTLFSDITEIKQAEKTLRESEARFCSVLDNSRDFIYRANLQTECYEYVSPSVKEILGYTQVEFASLGVQATMSIIHPTDLPPMIEALKRLEETGTGELEYRLRNKQGEYRWVSNHLSIIKDSSGRPLYRNGNLRDITERKQAEEALRQSEERFRTAFESGAIPMALANTNGELMKVNSAFCSLLGYSEAELTGHSFAEFTYPDDLPVNQVKAQDLYNDGKPFHMEKRYVRKDGAVVWADVNSAAVRNSNGSPKYVITHIQDINIRKQAEEMLEATNIELRDSRSAAINLAKDALAAKSQTEIANAELVREIAERKRAEEALRIYAAELASANKELESFSYSISHDLRSPLRTMKSFSIILLEDYLDKLDNDGQDLLKRIIIGADKMGGLIDDMLNLSKVSRQDIRSQQINLSQIAQSIFDGLKQSEPERNVDIRITEGLTAFGDSPLMHIALSNLIGNAWKYSSKNPDACIEVGAIEKDGETVFFIKDNGAGFDMTHSAKLFLPFHRLHSDREFSGTGIGLAIVNRVIQRHRGRIWAESEVGKGATFYLTIKKMEGV